MEKEMEYLLHLLKGFLWGETAEADESVDWARLQHLAQIHSVSGILGYMTMGAPIAPSDLRPGLRQDCLQTMNLYNRRAVLAEKLFAALADMGVDTCAMKGTVLRSLYPVPELRTFNDVDILVHGEDCPKIHAYMLEALYHCEIDHAPVFCYQRGEENYEIHTSLMDADIKEDADYRGFFAKAWEHTVEIAPHRYEMEKEFHLIYLIAHIAKHASGFGAGIRMYLDIAAYLKAYAGTLDWGKIFAWLEELNLARFGCAVLSAVEGWFGVSCPAGFQRLGEDALKRFARFTLEAGVYGHQGRDMAVYGLRQNEGSRLGLIFKRLFPGRKELKDRYPYLQTKPWLLPVAWLQRMIQTPKKVKDFTQEAKGILTYEEEEIQRLKAVCKEIGLE